jgi:hypothetical protein
MIVTETYSRMHIGLLRNNYCGMLEFRWSSRVPVMSSVDWHSIRTLAECSKSLSARPQRVKARGVPSGYVEGLNDARTMLAGFFSILGND